MENNEVYEDEPYRDLVEWYITNVLKEMGSEYPEVIFTEKLDNYIFIYKDVRDGSFCIETTDVEDARCIDDAVEIIMEKIY